jgi:acetyl esterase/lipase
VIRKRSRMRRFLIWGGLLLGLGFLGIASIYWWWFEAPHVQTADVEYGERDGKPLLLDVFTPPKQNGAGVLLMVSGGWKSGPGSVRPFLFAPFLRRGYTVFAVRHISQPECLIGDIVDDMHRAVRFVRHHAVKYGVQGDQLGVIGGSSGGHLSLMLGTRGGLGNPDATDPISQESSAVQCVACFYPPTDLLNLGNSTENPGDGGPPKSFRKGFGPRAEIMEQWKGLGKDLSPIYHITSDMPPTMIVHGDADTLVPIEQSERFIARSLELGRTVRFETRPGKAHGWPTMVLDIIRFADWFDQHLRKN